MPETSNLNKGLRKAVKRGLLKVLSPYHIEYISPKDKKLLMEAKKTKSENGNADTENGEKSIEVQEAADRKCVEDRELAEVRSWLKGFDRDHIWAFNSGHSGQDFRGNPKFLFAYINYYRPDIKAYWLCRTEETIDAVRALGFHGFLLDSPAAAYAIEQTGVAVNEQVRGLIPFDNNTKLLNLWHGHGFKTCERARIEDDDDLRLELAAKYIKCNSLYQNNEIVCCVNPLQEKNFLSYMGVPKRNMLHAGYARCVYQQKYKPIETFDHDILGEKGLPPQTKLAVYAPTFRTQRGNTFAEAIPDLEELYGCCERNQILLIFKMHPLMEDETGFLNAKETYKGRPYFLFWDNRNDIYEIINRIDLLIYDYSSIFNDFLLGGVTNYIRYIYDSENMVSAASINNEDEYYQYTYGTICRSYVELLDAIDHLKEDSDPEKLAAILKQQWEYSDEDDLERTIQFTLDFEIGHDTYPTLYSFDIFDTLFSREGLKPESIFFAVRDELRKSNEYERALVDNYPHIRVLSEAGLREYTRKTQEQRKSIKTEITLEQIYRKIQDIYNLTDEQTLHLMELELDAELASVVPLTNQIDYVKELLARGEKVILISDMYLPKAVILRMLKKADPILAELPLFLSNEYGVLKSNRLLFFEVYRSFKPYYNFGKWIHTGDNVHSDQNQPRKLCINTRLVRKPEFNDIENQMAGALGSYDAYKVAAMQARMRDEFSFPRSTFVIDYVAPLMVSYVDWALRDAKRRGFETLYFVSRDGHPLKRIADALIEANGWTFKTKYIYGSRRLWRVPSYIDSVDDEFFADYGGNFNDIHTKDKFLHATNIEDEDTFRKLFPQIDLDGIDFNDWSNGQPARNLAKILRANDTYHAYLLEKAKEQRVMVCDYLRQEIDPTEKHAFIEFWGRGYNQNCHSRLWNETLGHEVPLYYYYARVLCPTEGCCVRYPMTTNAMEMFFVETLFANMPYKSVEAYQEQGGRIVPVFEPIPYDRELFEAMELLLPEYACRYAGLNLADPVGMDRGVFDFLLDYFSKNKKEPFIYENFGTLTDAVSIYGNKREFAPPYTEEDIEDFRNGVPRGRKTMSITMSYARSTPQVKSLYDELYQLEQGDDVAGSSYLKPIQLEENQKYKTLLEKEKLRAKNFESRYMEACERHDVENLITLLSINKDFGDVFYTLLKCLDEQKEYAVEKFSCSKVSKEREIELADLLARSRYIIVNGNIALLSGLNFREETVCILLGNSAFELSRKGHAASYKLRWRKRYQDFLCNTRVGAFDTASSIYITEKKQQNKLNPQITDVISGSAITDVYYSQEFKQRAFEKLYKKFPAAEGKKLILYMPDLRKRQYNARWLELLDIEKLQKLLGDEYVVAIDTRNRKELLADCPNRLEILGFSCLINSEIHIRELMVTADIIVGDYRATLFETVLLQKPVFFTGFDFEKKLRDANMIHDFSEINPFPVVRTAGELAAGIVDLEQYDYTSLQAFREKYFEFCDGHTAERILDYMKRRMQ